MSYPNADPTALKWDDDEQQVGVSMIHLLKRKGISLVGGFNPIKKY